MRAVLPAYWRPNEAARVSGIDAAAGLMAYARERVPQGDFRVGKIEMLPFDDNTFSAVITALLMPDSKKFGWLTRRLDYFKELCE